MAVWPSRPRSRDPMSSLRERCPACTRRLITTRFDTTFRLPDRTERLCFGIPGGLCEDCHQLYIEPDLIELLDLRQQRIVEFLLTPRTRLLEETSRAKRFEAHRPHERAGRRTRREVIRDF